MTTKLNEEIQNLNNLLQNEKKSREETEEVMLEMLKEMIAKLRSDLESEKKERETTEETLLSLLENTCSKIQLLSNNNI